MRDEAVRHYQGGAGRDYHRRKRGIPNAAIPWVAELRAAKLAPYIRADDHVLEFGAGAGWNLIQLVCAAKLAYDVEDFLAPEAREAGARFVSDLEAVPASSQEVVVCHHALEHTIDPARTLDRLRRILTPDGTLLLHVPYEKERRYCRYDPNEPNHHLYSWNPQTLGNLVSEKGFRVLDARVAEFGYDRFAAAWAVRLRLGRPGFRWIRRLGHLFRPLRETRVVAVLEASAESNA